MDKDRLETLLSNYREQAKPLMDDINARLGVYPENCLNEIRAMLDHVSRCYRADDNSDLSEEEKNKVADEELAKAESHLRRLMYDCFKQLNILLYDAIHEQEKKTYSSHWLYIDGGKFWSDYTNGLQKAIESVVDAKKNESYEPDLAMECYDSAYNSYCAVEQILIRHKKDLLYSRCLKYIEAVNNWATWIVLTVVLSIISSLISYFLF